jgi:hypothetical protein
MVLGGLEPAPPIAVAGQQDWQAILASRPDRFDLVFGQRNGIPREDFLELPRRRRPWKPFPRGDLAQRRAPINGEGLSFHVCLGRFGRAHDRTTRQNRSFKVTSRVTGQAAMRKCPLRNTDYPSRHTNCPTDGTTLVEVHAWEPLQISLISSWGTEPAAQKGSPAPKPVGFCNVCPPFFTI